MKMKRILVLVLLLVLGSSLVFAQSGNAIVNGDFEQGPGVGWWTQSSHGYTLIYHDSDLPITPRSGHYAAWLGGNNNEESWLYQRVNMPVGDPHLTFWYWVNSSDAPGYDLSLIIVDDTAVSYLWLCVYSNTNGWFSHTVDLSAYAEQTVTLYFYVSTDEEYPSSLLLDDISIHSSATPTPIPTNTPIPVPTSTPIPFIPEYWIYLPLVVK